MAVRARRTKDVQVDEESQLDQSDEQTTLLTGAVPEGQEAAHLRDLAKRIGWREREEWDRDPEQWTDAPAFLEGITKQVEDLRASNRDLRERNERVTRAAADAIEEDRRRAREEATRVIRQSEDPEERAQAAQRLERNSGPHPETQAWMAKNPWFQTDPDAQAMAVSAINRAAQASKSISAQLDEAEQAVKRRFPEYFAGGTEQRLSDVRRQAPTPPAVQQGNRASASTPREKGFADIPAADRQTFRTTLLRKFEAAGISQADAEARYARSYWGTGVLPPAERGEEAHPLTPTRRDVWRQRGVR